MKIGGSTLLLVGGAGLVGSHLADLLTTTGAKEIRIFDNFVRGTRENLTGALEDSRVTVIEGDIRHPAELAAAMRGVDGVFLLAAMWLLQCSEDPRLGLDVNVLGNFNVLEACREAGVQRMVFSSSASVYGNALTPSMTEEHPLNNRTFYGASKVAIELMLRSYREMYGFDYVALRYFNVYGPRQDYRNAYVSVIMKILDRLDAGLPPLVFGDGQQAYDFVYVRDIARANLAAMAAEVSDDVFNVATGVRTSVLELTELLQRIVGTDLPVEFRPAGQVLVTDRLGSPDHAARVLGFLPGTSLREGLEELVTWRAGRLADDARQLQVAG